MSMTASAARMFSTLFLAALIFHAANAAPRIRRNGKAPLHSQAQQHRRVPGQYIVVFKDTLSDEEVDAVVDAFDASRGNSSGSSQEHSVKRFKRAMKGFSVRCSVSSMEALRDLEAVAYVEEDAIKTTSAVASWGLDRVNQRDLPLDDSDVFQGSGSGVHVYIIDTGTSKTHQEFTNRFSTSGYDYFGGPIGVDYHYHGTHCGGTACGSYVGMAWTSTIHSVRVLDATGSGTSTTVIAGIDWVEANAVKPAVASLSIGGGYSYSENQAIKSLSDSGVFVTVAAGNDDVDACTESPASAPEVGNLRH
ncbi:extracellular serine proteinase-like [Amphiura filiformis]|uniref:extracellular serine proteinase-like n=1 Tax=Amphiura filiformis TaxID=82378 RepID=UPI003B214395